MGPFSLAPLVVIDSTAISSRTFLNVPGMPSTNYLTSRVRYRLRAVVTWPVAFAAGVKGWTRSSGTKAWKDINAFDYQDVVDTATFVPAPFGTTGATVEAFVFRVKNASNPSQTIGWFPTDPAHASAVFTVIGTRATSAVGQPDVAAKLAVTTFPNPSREFVRLAVSVSNDSHVRGMVIDLRVKTLFEGNLKAGRHDYTWDGRTDEGLGAAAGVYFCRVDCAGVTTVQSFVRLNASR